MDRRSKVKGRSHRRCADSNLCCYDFWHRPCLGLRRGRGTHVAMCLLDGTLTKRPKDIVLADPVADL